MKPGRVLFDHAICLFKSLAVAWRAGHAQGEPDTGGAARVGPVSAQAQCAPAPVDLELLLTMDASSIVVKSFPAGIDSATALRVARQVCSCR